MNRSRTLRVVLVKASKYGTHGMVERFRRGFMPNSTLPHLASMTPRRLGEVSIDLHAVDEYVHTDLDYLRLLEAEAGCTTLLALVGVQSHQFHRALDLSAYALAHGVRHVVIGGPHAITCDTEALQNRGVSFALAEAETVWMRILADAVEGELRPTYGEAERWQQQLDPPVLVPPSKASLRRYWAQALGVYPARGCPYRCNFCSVIQIAGRQIRSEPVETTLATLRAAKAAGVSLIMFTSDNFNKYPEADTLLQAMIDERLDLPFFAQCDTQILRQPELVERMGRAGCYQIFLGVESFDRRTLVDAKKSHNHPEHYREIVALCRQNGIAAHFSNIIGFPTDTERSVLDQLRMLRALRPQVATFFILCPIPGTEQYDDFLAQGLIDERNLDRFDGTCSNWRHPHLSRTQLTELLFRCYREFFAARDAIPKSAAWFWHKRASDNVQLKAAVAGYSILSRVRAIQRTHPMAGGIFPISLDHVSAYLPLRRARYDCDLVPLPASRRHLAPAGAA